MEKGIIEELWDKIVHSNNGEFEYKLLSKDSVPVLNIGYNRKNQRCLILELPVGFKFNIPDNLKENISLIYFKRENCLCIILNDDYFKDLFDDLILSIYSKIWDIKASEIYSDLFVKYFHKWSNFFDNKQTDTLTKEQLKGLFGELVFLKNQLLGSNENIDDILNSWRGPYNAVHDFINDFIDYEIKTVEHLKNEISISSEFQLECDKGKDLKLVTITVSQNIESGICIKHLADDIKDIIYKKLGDVSIFITALSQININSNTIIHYDSYRFNPLKITFYNCTENSFPKLIKSLLPAEINNIKYNIKLNLINEFIANEIKL